MVARIKAQAAPEQFLHLVIGDPSADPDCPICRAHGSSPGTLTREVIDSCTCPLCMSMKERE